MLTGLEIYSFLEKADTNITKVDLGIAKYHFELGAGKENFKWI